MKRLALSFLCLLLPATLHAAPFEADTTLPLVSHPDGEEAAPWYGLRLDGLDGSEVGHHDNEWTFDFGDDRSDMTIIYDSHTARLHIEGTSWGGEDIGQTYRDGGSLYEISFTYENVVDYGDTLEVAAGGANFGSIRDVANDVRYELIDFAGGNDYSFRCALQHREAPRVCYGWLNHSGAIGGTKQHVYASDWLFKVGPAPAIPEPSAALLFGLGSVLCGSAVRRRD